MVIDNALCPLYPSVSSVVLRVLRAPPSEKNVQKKLKNPLEFSPNILVSHY